jgi:hypothetical protein
MRPPFEPRVSGDGRTSSVERPSIAEDLCLFEFQTVSGNPACGSKTATMGDVTT